VTITEFVASIQNIGTFTHTERIKLFAWYLLRYQKKTVFTAADISKCFEETTLAPPSSISPFLNSLETRRRKFLIRSGNGFALEHTIVVEFDKRYGQRPSAIVVRSGLTAHLSKVTDPALIDYLTETIGCFEHGHFRASIVMGWCAGYAILKVWLFSGHAGALNAVMATWRPPKTLPRIEDLEEHTERCVLDTARTAGVLTKGQHKHLVELLDQRNSFAHPSGRKISPALAEAYLIQIIDEVVTKYS
jgi:hypothetical protein